MQSPSLRAFCAALLIAFCFSSENLHAQDTIQTGIDLYRSANIEGAATFFSRYITEHKDESEAHYYLGRVLFDKEDFEKATDHFKKASDIAPDSAKYYLWIGHAYGSRAQRASKIRQPALVRSSRLNYEKAIELEPESIKIRRGALDFYLQAPGFLGGGRDKAEEQARAIGQINPLNGILAEASIHSYYKEAPEYEQTLLRAMEQFPKALSPTFMLFNFYYSQQQFQKALAITDSQLALNDTLGVIFLNRGNALDQLSRPHEAMQSFLRALELDPNLFGAHYQIGKVAAVSGQNPETGLEHIRTFLSFNDRYDTITHSWAYYRYGTILEQMDDLDAAKEQYRLAVQLNPEHQEAKQALARLDQ